MIKYQFLLDIICKYKFHHIMLKVATDIFCIIIFFYLTNEPWKLIQCCCLLKLQKCPQYCRVFSSNKWLNASDCEWCMISFSLSLSLVFVLFCNAYLSPSSYSHILPHIVRVLVVLHNLLICDKCLCLGCNNLLFFPQGSSIMILFYFSIYFKQFLCNLSINILFFKLHSWYL